MFRRDIEIPDRVRCRSSCFVHVSLLDEISRGAMIAAMILIIGSIDILLGRWIGSAKHS